MKDYPSIPGSFGQDFREFDAYIFDKIDGSNLRAQFNSNRGFYKFGTRNRLFDETDPVFSKGVGLFKTLFEDKVADAAKKERWESVIIFAEFAGPNSFAGWHDPSDNHTLALFDIAPHKKGLLGPKEFLKITKDWHNVVSFLGIQRWTRGFVQQIREDKIAGVTFEGVVGKTGDGHKQIRAKAKTQKWVDKVLAKYGNDEGSKIVNS